MVFCELCLQTMRELRPIETASDWLSYSVLTNSTRVCKVLFLHVSNLSVCSCSAPWHLHCKMHTKKAHEPGKLPSCGPGEMTVAEPGIGSVATCLPAGIKHLTNTSFFPFFFKDLIILCM